MLLMPAAPTSRFPRVNQRELVPAITTRLLLALAALPMKPLTLITCAPLVIVIWLNELASPTDRSVVLLQTVPAPLTVTTPIAPATPPTMVVLMLPATSDTRLL